MLVTDITEQKRDTGKLNIFIDGEYVFALLKEDVAYFKIKIGEELSQKTFDYISETLVYIKAQDTALYYIGYKMRTEKEVIKKLMEKEFSQDTINKVMDFLRKYNYINDEEYAEKYFRHRQKSSPRSSYAIKYELKQKGICDDILENNSDCYVLDEVADICYWVNKKSNGIIPLDFKKKEKLINFLQRKGYKYSVIKEAFEIIINDRGEF